MADLRDGFLAAVTAYLATGAALQLLAAPLDCCAGRLTDGPAGCTCWTPVYDLNQTAPDPTTVAALALGETTPDVRDGMCGDCAYRPGSPEKRGQTTHTGDATELDRWAADGQPFYCHDGMRAPIAWQHPAGMRIPADPDRDGDYQPLIVLGVPYRADGQPGLLCAGWSARSRALSTRKPRSG
jgi:hypothetical protein